MKTTYLGTCSFLYGTKITVDPTILVFLLISILQTYQSTIIFFAA